MKRTVLPSGLTVYTAVDSNATFFTMSYVVKVGSFYEKDLPKGISHFTEHMMFKGTPNRTCLDINKEITRVGGDLNALTSFDHTRYYAIVPFHKWELAAEILSDMIWNSTFPEKEFKLEKNIVLDEIRMEKDEPSNYYQEALQKRMFPKQTERQSVAGTLSSVKSITIENMRSFVDTYYTPDNMAVIATGNFNEEELLQFMESYPITRAARPEPIDRKYLFPLQENKKMASYYQASDMEQAHLSFGLYGLPYSHPDYYAYQMLYTLMGDTANSRLYTKIREEKGLSYDVYLDECSTPIQSIIFGHMGTDIKDLPKAREILLEEFSRLSHELVPQEELNDLKTYTEGVYLIRMGDIAFLNGFFTLCFLYDEFLTPTEYLAKLAAVTPEDIQRVAKEYFQPDNFILIEFYNGEEE